VVRGRWELVPEAEQDSEVVVLVLGDSREVRRLAEDLQRVRLLSEGCRLVGGLLVVQRLGETCC
jgi:hypothetical protein